MGDFLKLTLADGILEREAEDERDCSCIGVLHIGVLDLMFAGVLTGGSEGSRTKVPSLLLVCVQSVSTRNVLEKKRLF